MQGEDSEQFLEGGIESCGVAFLKLHQVKIVVGIDGGEFCPQKKAVFFAEKNRFNDGEFFDGCLFHEVVVRKECGRS